MSDANKELRSNPRPLGYIKPNVIKSILRGEAPDASIGYEAPKIDEVHAVGDTWIDAEDRTWIQRDGFIERVGKYDEIRKELSPYMCPQCGRILRSKADDKFMKLRNKCTDCVVVEDTDKIIHGTMEKYERTTMLTNAKSYFTDIKAQLEEYIKSLNPNQEYINEDGRIERWESDITEQKTFFTKELKEVDEMLEKIDKELEEVSKL